jgi:hypothetical protein
MIERSKPRGLNLEVDKRGFTPTKEWTVVSLSWVVNIHDAQSDNHNGGKRALWRALSAIAASDARLRKMDFNELIARAESQHDRVEERRLAHAPAALRPI